MPTANMIPEFLRFQSNRLQIPVDVLLDSLLKWASTQEQYFTFSQISTTHQGEPAEAIYVEYRINRNTRSHTYPLVETNLPEGLRCDALPVTVGELYSPAG